MLIVKSIKNETMYSGQELHLCLFLSSARVILAIFTSSTFSVHSRTNLSTNFFQHSQFSQSKYSPESHDLSYSNSQLLGFLTDPLSHTPFSTNSLNLHLHLSSFQRCLLLQLLASNLHSHLHVSCHFMCLVSLVLYIRLNTLTFTFLTTSGKYSFAYGLLILLQLPLHLLILILEGKMQGHLH